jgi:hypothetical protein
MLMLAASCLCLNAGARDFRGAQFIGFDDFSSFKKGSEQGVLLSPRIQPEIPWDQLIASWNFRGDPEDAIEIEVKLFFEDHSSGWYSMGKWAGVPGAFPRESVKGQDDADAHVDTDTLITKRRGQAVQVRIRLKGDHPKTENIKFLGLSFRDSRAHPEPLQPDRAAWGKTLAVKERSQANYPEGIKAWCSPTSLSMLLSFWATNLNRADLDHDVPEVARGVNDPNWPGTGNWPFNTAYAGSHAGMRAYVTRFSDVSELEQWIVAGYPVAISVFYNWLKGVDKPGNGHLVVCIGFTGNGDIIVNDPGRSHVQQTYTRSNLERAWAASKNTVYLVYPENLRVPKDHFGHWFSGPVQP